MFNDTYMGKKVWAMGDIVVLHPEDENYFKIIGRMDDQIMLSSGEKVSVRRRMPERKYAHASPRSTLRRS